MKLTKRILCLGHIQGYIAEDEAGKERPLTYGIIVDGLKDGTLPIENATVTFNKRLQIDILRGKGCGLQKLPAVIVNINDPLVYCTTHVCCMACLNQGTKACQDCIKDDDFHAYSGPVKLIRP